MRNNHAGIPAQDKQPTTTRQLGRFSRQSADAGKESSCHFFSTQPNSSFRLIASLLEANEDLVEVQQSGLGDSLDLLYWNEDGRGYGAVEADQGYSFGAYSGLPAAEGEGGDVDSELAES